MNPRGERRTPRRARALAAALLGALVPATAPAGSLVSDPLDTRAPLNRGAYGFSDPGERDCALPAGKLTLGQAIDLALCRNPATRGAWAGARQQAAALGIAEAGRLPALSASGSENWSSGPRLASNGQRTDGEQRTADAALELSLTLFDFGGRRARVAS